jgi:hypothetical protein
MADRNPKLKSGLVNEKGLLEVIALTPRQLRELRLRRKIPYIRFGHRSVMYNIEKVVAALEKFELKEVQ